MAGAERATRVFSGGFFHAVGTRDCPRIGTLCGEKRMQKGTNDTCFGTSFESAWKRLRK
jgi:hypothetical protein